MYIKGGEGDDPVAASFRVNWIKYSPLDSSRFKLLEVVAGRARVFPG